MTPNVEQIKQFNGSSNQQISPQGVPSRQVFRQAERENAKIAAPAASGASSASKYPPIIQRAFAAGYGALIVPVAPPGSPLTDGSECKPESVGKIPMLFSPQQCGWYSWNWPNVAVSGKDMELAAANGCGYGMLAGKAPANGSAVVVIDCDIKNKKMAFTKSILKILGGLDVRCAAVRGRDDGSPSVAVVLACKPEFVPHWRAISWRDSDGEKHTVELLGQGQFFVMHGRHKSGSDYKWLANEQHLFSPKLTQVDGAFFDKFYTVLNETIEKEQWGTIIPSTRGGRNGTAAPRTSLDADPSRWAPSPQDVLKFMEAWPNTHENVPDHEDFVAATAMIKTALGKDREDYYPDFLQWGMLYPGNTEEYAHGRWVSVKESSSSGWRACLEKAPKEFSDPYAKAQAQEDFKNAPPLRADEIGVHPDDVKKSAVDRMVNDYAWCEEGGCYVRLASGALLSSKEFNAANTNVAEFGNCGTKSAESRFQNHPHAKKVEFLTYRPGQPLLITDTNRSGRKAPAFNRWCPPDLVPAEGATDDDVRPWLNHMRLIVGPLDSVAAAHVFNWQAFLLQHPGVKIPHALVIFGETQGTGKDTAFVPLIRALGKRNVGTIGPHDLAGQFTYWLQNQLIVVEEMMNFSKREIANKLKPMLANQPEMVTVNIKNVKQYDIPNIQNWLMFTNYNDAIPIEDTDRRYMVVKCCLESPKPPTYYEALYEWYEAGGIEKVAGWLKARDLSAFKPNAPPPETDAKAEMRELSQPAPVQWARRNLFDPGRCFAGRSVMIAQDVRDAARQDFGGPEVSHRNAAAALRLSEFTKADHQVRIDGAATRVWIRDPSGELAQFSGQQLCERYRAEKAKGTPTFRVVTPIAEGTVAAAETGKVEGEGGATA